MIEYQRLLCPIDFSDISDHVIKIAMDLADKLNAELHVIHVFHLPSSAFPEAIYSVGGDLDTESEDYYSKKLEKFVKNISTSKTKITPGLCEGVPDVEIIRYAEQNNADMIVMGTHGRTGLSHILLGSVAERVIRSSSIPVLSVRK